jgi:hypothetical protein
MQAAVPGPSVRLRQQAEFEHGIGVNALETVIRNRLGPGERVLWAGQPDVRTYALAGAWFLIPFSLLWGGFAIFWEIGVIQSRPVFFWLWGIPFVFVGLYMIFGRIAVAIREARRTVYAITNRRVMIRTGAFTPTWTEMALDDLPSTTLSEGRGGIGTIAFGPVPPYSVPPGWPTMGMGNRGNRFVAIPDASRVMAVIREAREAARPPR